MPDPKLENSHFSLYRAKYSVLKIARVQLMHPVMIHSSPPQRPSAGTKQINCQVEPCRIVDLVVLGYEHSTQRVLASCALRI